MVLEVVEKFNNGYSLEKLASEYKMGKLNIKAILMNNNISIKKKGGQIKNKKIEINYSKWDEKIVICNCCNKEFSDPHNKSGALISHMKLCYPDVNIPSKFKRAKYLENNGDYWHMQFFKLVDKSTIETFKCPECGWETKDKNNKAGAITKHIENFHDTISVFIRKYPNLSDLFLTQISFIDKSEMFENDESSYVVCQICEQKFASITETHLLKHNMNLEKYRALYPNNSVVSENLKNIFKEHFQNLHVQNLYRSKGEIDQLSD